MKDEGLFDIGIFESSDTEDMLKLKIFEEDTNVNIPGGIKETPSSKPADSNHVAIPGGEKETPSAKPYDQASISIPAGTTITVDQYNDAMDHLQKSFKEGVELLTTIRGMTIVEKSTDELQQEFMESAMESAMEEAAYESIINGPYFEAVQSSKKGEVQSIAKKLMGRIKIDSFLPLKKYASKVSAVKSSGDKFNKMQWQSVGILFCDADKIESKLKTIQSENENILKDFVVRADLLRGNSAANNETFKVPFGWFLLWTFFFFPIGTIGYVGYRYLKGQDKVDELSSYGDPYLIYIDEKDGDVGEITINISKEAMKAATEAKSKKKDTKKASKDKEVIKENADSDDDDEKDKKDKSEEKDDKKDEKDKKEDKDNKKDEK